MLTTKLEKTKELDFDKAVKRMQTHASNTRFMFSRSLKVKAPSTSGRLAGPLKQA